MKKLLGNRFLAIVAMIIISTVILSLCSVAAADYSDPYEPYFYQYAHPGTVVCSQLTVRTEPSTGARELGKLKNGQPCYIRGMYNDWYIIDLSSCGISSSAPYGFAKEALIKQDPYWIVLTKYTYMYATPWQKECKRNGEQMNRVCFVIEEEYPFYAVQCKELTPGTSFIYMQDVGQYSQPDQNLYVTVYDPIPVLDSPYGNQITSVGKFFIADVDSAYDMYYHIVINAGAENEISGWVDSMYLQKIIN